MAHTLSYNYNSTTTEFDYDYRPGMGSPFRAESYWPWDRWVLDMVWREIEKRLWGDKNPLYQTADTSAQAILSDTQRRNSSREMRFTPLRQSFVCKPEALVYRDKDGQCLGHGKQNAALLWRKTGCSQADREAGVGHTQTPEVGSETKAHCIHVFNWRNANKQDQAWRKMESRF
jgi:hypothetical protein